MPLGFLSDKGRLLKFHTANKTPPFHLEQTQRQAVLQNNLSLNKLFFIFFKHFALLMIFPFNPQAGCEEQRGV